MPQFGTNSELVSVAGSSIAAMGINSVVRLAHFKTAIVLLKGRERSLRQMAQSSRCANRSAAELELDRVRAEIENTYAQMRPLREHA